jgi:hypothetical protein
MSAYFAQLDLIAERELQSLPPECSQKEVTILCNDCEKYSVVPYHHDFLKCRASVRSEPEGAKSKELCGSYNTRIVGAARQSSAGQT